MVSENKIILICESVMVATQVVQALMMYYLVERFRSLFFLFFANSVQLCLIFGVIMVLASNGNYYLPAEKRKLLRIGLFSSMMEVGLIYTADLSRITLIKKSVISNWGIILSVALTRYLVKKYNDYDRRYTYSSLGILKMATVVMVYLSFVEYVNDYIPWLVLYMTTTICNVLFNSYQEMYTADMDNNDFMTNVMVVFFTRMFQVMILPIFAGLEYLIGYSDGMFRESLDLYMTNWEDCFLLQMFILSSVVYYLCSIHLNNISSNFNTYSIVVVNPIMILIMAIVYGAEFNQIWLSIPIIVMNVISIYLWIKGENRQRLIGNFDHIIGDW